MRHRVPNRTITLVLAIMSAIPRIGLAQAPAPAFTFKTVVFTGSTVAGVALDDHARIEGAALSDNAAITFLIRWNEQGGLTSHASLFTMQRVVVSEGDQIEGKTILRVFGNSIAINNKGDVAFFAAYSSGSGTRALYGLFLEHHLQQSFDPADPHTPIASRPISVIHLTDEGVILYMNESVFSPGGPLPPKDVKRLDGERQGSGLTCRPPALAKPLEWETRSGLAAPIFESWHESYVHQPYDSPVLGHTPYPFRTTYFSADCKPSVIQVGGDHGWELWTPSGMLGWSRADQTLVLNGFEENATFRAPRVPSLIVNRSGQILTLIYRGAQGSAPCPERSCRSPARTDCCRRR
jgi:hypothetical protein